MNHYVSCLTEVAQWRAERMRSPAKRGRKPGTGKKNMVKGVTGKVILVKVDLSRFENNTVLYQVCLQSTAPVVLLQLHVESACCMRFHCLFVCLSVC